jgi:hypothetical protein
MKFILINSARYEGSIFIEQCIAGMMIQIQIGTYELYDYILNSDSNSIKQGETLGPLGGLQQGRHLSYIKLIFSCTSMDRILVI